ncbi:sodium:solute symporter family protein [Neptunomonas phycophila]|uniref:Sodium:solute symporter family protein n=1 Tax=Neptunomonas phycophila TaxID=1572645 RepID=A0AAW7XLV1_9GAMM|nr:MULTISPECIES: sodium:solute symporter family protein [Neptunomonas]MBT3144370.1 cation acetate symporter [Neptunomonas phycophila]MDN2660516.1 cation acetate symporter [Neptunomonas sp. CHC150]MDO6455248.1 sodium:solute symporter family protein [Neptunomonas phycophila]MDO6469759.1 sodium:solute symporter family protein [Neptunomonas phycophila]MDO6785636.1 sodium:solute symporter family protein [Neptunomonas phycophila]
MSVDVLSYLFIGGSFLLYIGIAVWARAGSTKEFYVAGGGVHPVANGMATAADWMSAASFISLAGLVSFIGRDGSAYLMGWTGGYVLLAMLLAPYLRKFGKFTVPDFVGDRYESNVARTIAVVCTIVISFTYVAGQMRGVGIVFSRYLHVDINTGVIIGMAIVFFYAVLGGMKGITYTQVAQYCVLILAFTVPAFFLSAQVTGHILPQIGLGATLDSGQSVLATLDQLSVDLGFAQYTAGKMSTIDIFCLTVALMCGTAGLPHVIVRFFTVPRVKDARTSAGWALIFIALLYTAVPGVGGFGRVNLIQTVNGVDNTGTTYSEIPSWFKNWENAGLLGWNDRNGDGKIQYAAGNAFDGNGKPAFGDERGDQGQRIATNAIQGADFDASKQPFANELYVDRDIMVLANPDIAQLPAWVIALVAAGAVAAALSTAAGLLLVISTAVAHDLMKKTINPNITEKQELMYARMAAVVAICIAGYFGINPPGFVAQVVALAFGIACASVFPTIMLGIFYKRMNTQGAIAGMLVGLISTVGYMWYFVFGGGDKADYFMGIGPGGFGAVGMVLHFIVAMIVASMTPPPSEEMQRIVEDLRIPRGAGEAHDH